MPTRKSLQAYATEVVGAALRHDFGVPLGVIGRNVEFIRELVNDDQHTQSNTTLAAIVNQISEKLLGIEKELYISFRGFGRDVGALADFERQKRFRELNSRIDPLISEAITYSDNLEKALSKSSDRDLIKQSQQVGSAFRRIRSMLAGLTHFIHLDYLTEDAFQLADLSRIAHTASISARLAASNSSQSAPFIQIEGSARIECIPSLIEQLVQNFVSNAIKYSMISRLPRVSVQIEENTFHYFAQQHPLTLKGIRGQGQWVRLSVMDNGPGVDRKVAATAFKLYVNMPDPRIPVESTGVGLAVCQLVATAHGGLVYHDREENMTRFFALLPQRYKDQIH